jgi:hypothetical protein
MFRKMNMLILVLIMGLCISLPAAEAFVININPGAGLSGNADALAAFNRGAAQWTKYFNDPITVTIDADLAALGPGIIGSASSVFLTGGYTTIRNQMVADAATDPNNSIVAKLPTIGQFSGYVPAGWGISSIMWASKANLKAMGFTGLDAGFGVTDATITFSSAFTFDFDKSNGVTGGMMDFETVAAHEIGMPWALYPPSMTWIIY